ncbi:hypothetical protein E5167_06675 [Pontimicrobium aquaticum]|uniref:DUF2158 domain-containing protein n=1 Tax=Pontimicrobium aquaticum TaxID=2565367 RepID=A0A4U0EWP0_9FLAO|nr:hypothetical protein E5167_06675 [Pontimicrobium aquaticum]
MPKKFKPGDWVKIKGNLESPKMEVLKYISKKNSLGLISNDNYLQCVWYKNGKRYSGVFHQNNLIKFIKTGGLYNT